MSIVALLSMSACSSGGEGSAGPFGGDDPLAPASNDEIGEAIAAFQPGVDAGHVDRSAVDSLTEQRRSELGPTAALLVGLLPSPDGFGSFQLANLQVEDPNGDGRIGEYWYPPRVLRQECSARIDAAPGPFALADYLPGAGALGDTDQLVAFDLTSSAVVVGVQAQLFDEAAQRDAYLATTLAFYRDPTFTCGGQQASVQTFSETELPNARTSTVVFEAEPALMGSGVRAYTAVGDRVLLTVSVSSDDVEAPWVAEDLDRWLVPVVDVALGRLDIAELP